MEREGDEVHLTTNEARAGRRGSTARNILLISLLLVVVAFAAIWLVGALNAPQGSHKAPISNQPPPTTGSGQ